MSSFIQKLKKIPIHWYILLVIFAVGVFLRTYHFHNWLEFGDDQIRDAYVTTAAASGKTSWPLLGPFMSYSGNGKHSEVNSFHLGPIYYYFQIISAKIFGNSPDKLAYPDVFFAILSIPLFYLFLRIYFSQKISLSLTGIYAISAYFISYSRFAWNTNLIPFFVLLFLLSLYKFILADEKTSWLWVISLGFALGVGFQLHAITMVLFSMVAFLVFVFTIIKNYQVWKRWVVVFLIFLILNSGQVISECRTNFSNTKTFLRLVTSGNSVSAGSHQRPMNLLKNDADCQVEANLFFLSSYGNESCSHDYLGIFSLNQIHSLLGDSRGQIRLAILSVGLVFSIFGYFLLIYYDKNEKDKEKKYFLWLISSYLIIGFLIMIPLSEKELNDFRYLTFSFFGPFLFLGFLMKWLNRKLTTLMYIIPVAIIFGLLITSDVYAISSKANVLIHNNVTCSSLYMTTLGEVDPVAQYITSHCDGTKRVYLGNTGSQRIINDSLCYLLKQKNINSTEIDDDNYPVFGDKNVFYVSCKMPELLPMSLLLKMGDNYVSKNVGAMYVIQLENNNVSITQ